MKWRNSKERELLSSGGSRESTMPTKSDLNGDCGEDPQKPKDLGDELDGILAEDDDTDDVNDAPSGAEHELSVGVSSMDQIGPQHHMTMTCDLNDPLRQTDVMHTTAQYSDSDDEDEEIDVS